MEQVDGDFVVVSKSCSWPPSCNGSIDTVLEVLLEEGSDSSVSNSESISSYEDATGLHFARPTADSGPFEITVAFQRRLCHIRTIYILSSARTCEIYSQQAGSNDFEYVCTARGELLNLSDKDSEAEEVKGDIEVDEAEELKGDIEVDGADEAEEVKGDIEVDEAEEVKGDIEVDGADEAEEVKGDIEVDEADEADAVVAEFLGSASASQLQQVVEAGVEEVNETAVEGEPLYEIEVEFVNSDAWAAVRLRLLSLHDKMVMKIKRVILSGLVGPPPSIEAVDSNGNGSSASLMAMLMPTVLQMMRNDSRAGDQTAQNHQRPVQPATHEKTETQPSVLSSDPVPTAAATVARIRQPEAEEQSQDFRNEIRGRLHNLEIICSRMESYLHLAFGKLDDRVGNVELQIRTMQEHSLFAGDSSSAESSGQSLQATPQSEPVLPETGTAREESDHDAREEHPQEDEPEDMQQVEPEDMRQIASTQTRSSAVQHSRPVLTEAGVAGEAEPEDIQQTEPEDVQQIEPEDVQQIAPSGTHSISLDDAWVSALTSSTAEASAIPAESSNDDPQRLVAAEPAVLVREAGSLIDAELPAEAREDQGQLSAEDLHNESAVEKELPPLLDMEQNVAGQDGTDKQQAASGGSVDLTELLCSSSFPEVVEASNTASDAEIFSDASDLLFLPSYEERDAAEAPKAEEHPRSASRRSVEDSLLELTPEL